MAEPINPWAKEMAAWTMDQLGHNLVALRFRHTSTPAPANADLHFAELFNRDRQRVLQQVQTALETVYAAMHRERGGYPPTIGWCEQQAEDLLAQQITEMARGVYGQAIWFRTARVHVLVEKPFERPMIFSGVRQRPFDFEADLYLNDEALVPVARNPQAQYPYWHWGILPSGADQADFQRASQQTALEICRRFLGDLDCALGVHEEFARTVLAPIQADEWALNGAEVGRHIRQITKPGH